MKKNEIEIEKNKLVGKLKEIQKAEEKLESDQKVISDKEKTTNISSEKEGLEKRRWELEENTKEIEKNRWAIEREIEGKNKGIETVDQDYKKMIEEENDLKQKNTDVDKQLRQIYSQIISKVQNTKKQEAEDKITAQGKTAKAEAIEKENIQRKQWTKSPSARAPEKEYLQNISTTAKENLNKQAEDEETHRQKFLQDIETKTNEENKK
jgi:hypothetical protein